MHLAIATQTKRPSAEEEETAIVPDVESADPPDAPATPGTAQTEDEDDTDALLQGMRRGRLENPSPGKGILNTGRPHGRSNSPEIM